MIQIDLKDISCDDCEFFDGDAQMGEPHCKLKFGLCLNGEMFKLREITISR